MSLFGAMISGVSGLNAQSQNLGVISDNISNLNTVGYKSTVGRFSTLVTQAPTGTSYTPGGVQFHPTALISKQGLLQATSSTTAAAISGDGFFLVRDTATPGEDSEMFFSRAGDFKPDDNGLLKNTAGYYVQGWATDRNGQLLDRNGNVTSSNSSAAGDLQVLDINSILTAAASTTRIEFGANFNSDETALNGTPTTSSTAGIVADTTDLTTLPGVNAGDTFTIAVGTGAPQTVTIAAGETLNSLAAKISALTGVTATVDTTSTNHTLSIASTDPEETLTLTDTNGDLGALGFGSLTTTAAFTPGAGNMASGAITAHNSLPITVYDSLGTAHKLNLQIVKLGQNKWGYELTGSTEPGQLDATTHPNGLIASGTLTFNGDGSLKTFTDEGGLSRVDQPITGITWTNGSEPSSFTLDAGTIGQTDGITQFAAGTDANGNLIDYTTHYINQDGARAGTMVNYGFTEDGYLQVEFANGVKRPVYKLAIATVESPDSLEQHTGNVYRQTRESGDYLLREPGQNGAGKVVASALEASNVDLAEEFTNMIVTQRAYSANTKTITTTDEMLDELIRVKR
ncbi:flagellar hook protein FlgE [Thalassospira profundimaris]|uniref:Flagellar hook protein FlgE n=1 Tax=Thalassospira profundimaris TaxID=502049 RepID=A0A367X3N0_9PROT|nr:flagellar hook-basal body complex protein [Thalassospira profundimaris]RCK48273.1 flagellar hook protein FlgE [Thalassospira profundimaris]